MASIETAIRAILTGASGVTDLVSTRIYPIAAPQSVDRPFIVYELEGTEPVDSLTGTSTLTFSSFHISIWSDSYATTKSVSAAVLEALGDYTGTSDTINIDWLRHDNTMDVDAWTADGAEFPLYGIDQIYNVAYQV